MPGEREHQERGAGPGGGAGQPRTDLPPTREPYEEDYFGTGEAEGVVRERVDAAPDAPGARRAADDVEQERPREERGPDLEGEP